MQKTETVGPRQRQPELYRVTDLGQISQALISWSGQTSFPHLIHELELDKLQDSMVVKATPRAGNGHKKVCFDVASAIELDSANAGSWSIVELDNLLAGKTHAAGSNNWLGKFATERMQEWGELQWALAWLHHELVLRNDSTTILAAAREFLTEAKRNLQKNVIFIAYHPDVAYVMAHYKHQLAREFGIGIEVVVVMTDHLPRGQFVWYPIDADLILAPDEESAATARAQAAFWERIMRSRRDRHAHGLPQVETINYPVNPFLIEPLTQHEFEHRRLQLRDESGVKTQILVPQGGAVPNQEFQLDFIRGLPASFAAHVVMTASDRTAGFKTQAEALGAQVIVGETTLKTHAAYLQAHAELNPSLMESKPSEKHNHALIDRSQRGGEIMLVAPPVGDQEKQNSEFMVNTGRALNEQQSRRLMTMSVDELKSNLGLATGLRTIFLPRDGSKAAEYLARLKSSGFLEAMLTGPAKLETANQGAREVWTKVNEYQGQRRQ